MYSSTGVGKLSESQKSKLRNGHPVRIKLGSGNTLNLTDQQIKKLQSAHKKGAAYTITFHPHVVIPIRRDIDTKSAIQPPSSAPIIIPCDIAPLGVLHIHHHIQRRPKRLTKSLHQ